MKPWMFIAALIVLVVIFVAAFQYEHRQAQSARQTAEAAQLQIKGQLVAEQATSAGLRQDVAQLVAKNADLRASYEAALAAAPGAQPVHAETLSTGTVVVAAGDNSGPMGCAPDAPAAPDKGSGSAASGAPERAAEMACVLHAGDAASITVDQVTLLTKAGNYIIAGAASAWRETPPRERLFGGKINATASSAVEREQPPPPGIGMGVTAACGGTKPACAFGGEVMLPPWHHLDAAAGLAYGGLGALVTARAGWRF